MAGAGGRLPRHLPVPWSRTGDRAAVQARRSHPRACRRDARRVVTELFVLAVWAAHLVNAHIAFQAQRVKLAPVMKKLRQGLVPAVLIALGLAPQAQAYGMPTADRTGAGVDERGSRDAMWRDGISLDEAVRRAEQQFRARVVRTDVQDEDGRTVYVLKLLSEDGRVITVRIDAATGRMR